MMYLGDWTEDSEHFFTWPTNDASGASITRATDGTVKVYKDGATGTETVVGVTDGEDHDGLTGVHLVTIDTSDAFYATGADYHVILVGAVIDGETVNVPLAHFSIQNRYNPPLTGVVLHGDYDAAKTAAQAGDEMDLVDAPNATAITAIQDGLATVAALAVVDGIVDKFNTMVVADGAVWQFTANAIEKGPGGSTTVNTGPRMY